MRKFNIKDMETGKIFQWTLDDILTEINRDRSADWLDYNTADWEEGWFAWVDGVCLEILEEIEQ